MSVTIQAQFLGEGHVMTAPVAGRVVMVCPNAREIQVTVDDGERKVTWMALWDEVATIERHPPVDVERLLREQFVEATQIEMDRTMLTACAICGQLGHEHLCGSPPGCTGFTVWEPKTDA